MNQFELACKVATVTAYLKLRFCVIQSILPNTSVSIPSMLSWLNQACVIATENGWTDIADLACLHFVQLQLQIVWASPPSLFNDEAAAMASVLSKDVNALLELKRRSLQLKFTCLFDPDALEEASLQFFQDKTLRSTDGTVISAAMNTAIRECVLLDRFCHHRYAY